MSDIINFKHLKDESHKYSDAIHKEKQSPDGLGIAKLIQSKLSDKIKSIVITNIPNQERLNKSYFILKINSEQIELLDVNPNIKNSVLYEFQSNRIYLNAREMPPVFFNSFKIRLKEIMSKLKHKKASAFEEGLA